MATLYGGYTNVSQITGPSGWYSIKVGNDDVFTYVNQSYSGGGWVLVAANRQSTGGMGALTYSDAVNSCNFRTGGSNQGANTTTPADKGFGSLANYNVWIGTKYWKALAGRVNPYEVTVVQYVATTNGVGLDGTHTKRYRWKFKNFSSTYAFQDVAAVSDETGTGSPGMYNYHAVNGFNLTTYDNDQDVYTGGNCSTFYLNNPWWYGACWSGNYFAGGGYADAPYWDGSGSDYHQYGAIYIK